MTFFVILAALSVPLSAKIAYPVLFCLLLIVAVVSTIPARYIVQRLALLVLIASAVGLLSLFRANGAQIFLTLVIRSSLCLMAVLLFANTTPFSALLETLSRYRVPSLVLSILALLYRYLFVLVDEMERMERARKSRTFTMSRRRARASLVTVIAQAFVRSAERAERIFAAMVARGWN